MSVLKVVIICGGSFRRGKASCGDLDIIITHPDGKRCKLLLLVCHAPFIFTSFLIFICVECVDLRGDQIAAGQLCPLLNLAIVLFLIHSSSLKE